MHADYSTDTVTMPRSRILEPAFFKHAELYDAEKASGLPLRLAFAGLWTVTDREGRFLWRPRETKLDVLPYDDVDFCAVMDALEKYGFVRSYVVDGKRYGVIPTFSHHQTFHKHEAKSKLPPPPLVEHVPTLAANDIECQPVSVSVSVSSTVSVMEPTEPQPLAIASTETEPLDYPPHIPAYERKAFPGMVMPPAVKQFVDEMYGLATEQRRWDVKRQLFDAIDPTKRGAFLRRGVYVKAKDADHLARVCTAVRLDPPQQLDSAIVYVLRKLQDAETDANGRTVTESASFDQKQTDALLERYEAAAKSAANAWVLNHRDEYDAIRCRLVAQFFPGGTVEENSFKRMAYDAAHLSEVRKASGFPDFETWRANLPNIAKVG